MTAIRLRPEGLRIGWRPIAGFAVSLYLIRSALRHWDFRPDLLDLVVFGGLTLLLVARPLVVRFLEGPEEHDD